MTATRHPLELLVRNLELRSPLPPADRQAVLNLKYTVRTLEAGTYTIREADPPAQCAVLVTGFGFRQKLAGDGARTVASGAATSAPAVISAVVRFMVVSPW